MGKIIGKLIIGIKQMKTKWGMQYRSQKDLIILSWQKTNYLFRVYFSSRAGTSS